MSAALNRLLKQTEPIPDEVDRRMDQAFNTAPSIPAVVTDWEGYVECLATFYWHLERTVLGVAGLVAGDTDWHVGRTWQLLKKELGDSALKAGFERARTGNAGGMLSILRLMARLNGDRWGRAQIANAVGLYWRDRSADELLRDSLDYLKTYGHLLPSEMTEGDAARLRASFHKVLREHPFMVRRMAEVARSGQASRFRDHAATHSV